MPDYRVYIIGTDGHFQKAIPIDSPDDATAVETAKQYIDGHDIELWQRDRLLAKFARHRPKDATGWLKGGLKPPE